MTILEPMPSTPTREVTGPSLARLAAVLGGMLVLAAALCACTGQLGWQWPWQDTGLWTTRLYRVATAATVGAALAVAGATLQSLLRNALADPSVLGVSSGAGVGVLSAMVLVGGGAWALRPFTATAGAAGTMVVVYLVAQRRGRLDAWSLLLSGVIVNAFNGAIMLSLYMFALPSELKQYIHWSIGSIPDFPSGELLGLCGGLTALSWAWLLGRAQAFNVQSLGDDVAASSGIHMVRLRIETFGLASLLTAAAVALAGPVGFLGLIVPHVGRLILGADHRRLILASGFIGAAFLVLADTFCRSTVLRFGQELPVGVVTALTGVPFFLVLLRRRLREAEA